MSTVRAAFGQHYIKSGVHVASPIVVQSLIQVVLPIYGHLAGRLILLK